MNSYPYGQMVPGPYTIFRRSGPIIATSFARGVQVNDTAAGSPMSSIAKDQTYRQEQPYVAIPSAPTQAEIDAQRFRGDECGWIMRGRTSRADAGPIPGMATGDTDDEYNYGWARALLPPSGANVNDPKSPSLGISYSPAAWTHNALGNLEDMHINHPLLHTSTYTEEIHPEWLWADYDLIVVDEKVRPGSIWDYSGESMRPWLQTRPGASTGASSNYTCLKSGWHGAADFYIVIPSIDLYDPVLDCTMSVPEDSMFFTIHGQRIPWMNLWNGNVDISIPPQQTANTLPDNLWFNTSNNPILSRLRFHGRSFGCRSMFELTYRYSVVGPGEFRLIKDGEIFDQTFGPMGWLQGGPHKIINKATNDRDIASFQFFFRNLSIGDPFPTCEIDNVRIYDYVRILGEFTQLSMAYADYAPIEIETLRGFKVFQQTRNVGTAMDGLLMFYDSNSYIDFIQNIEKVHVITDSLGIPYRGVIVPGNVTRYGDEVYEMSFTFKSPNKLGVGWV